MGFEDGVEQSLPRPCYQTSDRSKRTYELTSSIVPRGTSFHGLAEFELSPMAFGYLRPSCYCGLSGPPELSPVNPNAVHDHRQPARQRHDRLLHSGVSGDLHRPGLEPPVAGSIAKQTAKPDKILRLRTVNRLIGIVAP